MLGASCGAGGGTKTALPAGATTTAPPGDQVIYAALAQGDRVVASRPGTDGFLTAAPFSSVALENPRRLLLGNGVLYVALEDRVVSLTLGADGSLPATATAETRPLRFADFRALALSGNVLYAAAPGSLRVVALALESGQVPTDPISTSGTSLSDYNGLAIANGFLYAISPNAARIDTFVIANDGSLPDFPEPQVPESFVDFPEDLVEHDGTLYVVELGRQRVSTFPIRANGLLFEEPDSKTYGVERYGRIVIDGDALYVSAFNAGRIDMYRTDPIDGSLPASGPEFSTHADPAAFPNGMLVSAGILYVAQAGLDRIDGYVLGGDGRPSALPSTSTAALAGSLPHDHENGTFP